MAKKGFKIQPAAGGGFSIPEVDTGRVQPKRPGSVKPIKSSSFGDASLNPSQGGLNLPTQPDKGSGKRVQQPKKKRRLPAPEPTIKAKLPRKNVSQAAAELRKRELARKRKKIAK